MYYGDYSRFDLYLTLEWPQGTFWHRNLFNLTSNLTSLSNLGSKYIYNACIMVIIHDLTFIWPWNDLKWPFDTGIYLIWPQIWLLYRIWRRNICVLQVLRQVFQIWPFFDFYMTSNDLQIHFFEFYVKNGIDWCVYYIGFSLYSWFLVFFTSWSLYSVISRMVDPQVLTTLKIDSTGSKYPR